MRDGMIDREKVIKGLECCAVGAECDHCPYSSMNQSGHEGCYQMHADALALLKEQEPVEPIPTEDDDWICGACNNSVVGTEELDAGGFTPIRFNYCPNCGQAVKWNG